jgi:hypothetical protein
MMKCNYHSSGNVLTSNPELNILHFLHLSHCTHSWSGLYREPPFFWRSKEFINETCLGKLEKKEGNP